MNTAAVDWSPTLRLLLLAASLASLPLAWWWLRQRQGDVRRRLAALTTLVLLLTLDLIVLGAFTRLTDSGLGCPDWPGCYGEVSPWAAAEPISQAQQAMPTGPVTHTKAWIEMLHRYLAMVVGALILVLALVSTLARRQLPHSLLWPWLSLVWVVVQGLFGKYTVTLKLYPAVVTAHLLGALLLLALLLRQREAYRRALAPAVPRLHLSRGLVWGLWALTALVVVQLALGGWVSSNYAVLACQGFPQCNGQAWPALQASDWAQGFTLRRELGRAGHGGWLPFGALVAIHWAHRLMAAVLALGVLTAAVALWRQPAGQGRVVAMALTGALLWQVASGLGNVVLQWPLLGALAHSAGAAVLWGLLVSVLCRATVRAPQPLLADAPPVTPPLTAAPAPTSPGRTNPLFNDRPAGPAGAVSA